MMKSSLVLALFLCSTAFAAEYAVKGLQINTDDFVNGEKVSQDGRCKMKVESWGAGDFSSIYIYDKEDGDYQGSVSFKNDSEGMTLLAADGLNENCKLSQSDAGVSVVCKSFGRKEIVSLELDEAGHFKSLFHKHNAMGIAGHIPFPYAKFKTLECKF